MGGQQPHRIPRKPRDRAKINLLKTNIRSISIYKRLLIAFIPLIVSQKIHFKNYVLS